MARNLILCADGTWNEPTETDGNGVLCPTNVSLTYQTVDTSAPGSAEQPTQLAFYHDGIGVAGSIFEHFTGGAFGYGIDQIIQDCYLWLSNHYQPGDRLFLFGFSRGAYTVRSLAGLIRNCGLLRPELAAKPGMVANAYTLYRDRSACTHPTAESSLHFRSAHSFPDFDIHFIGVWDTVGALGIPKGLPDLLSAHVQTALWDFHDVELSSHVTYAYQALAIDERRKPFQPSIWTQKPDAPVTQVLEQAWFPGVHGNVGGGYADAGLSNGALHWMWNRAQHAGLRLTATAPYTSEPDGVLRDSMTLGYRILGDGTRILGTHMTASAEGTAAFTLQRKAYGPRNLQQFRTTYPRVYPQEVG